MSDQTLVWTAQEPEALGRPPVGSRQVMVVQTRPRMWLSPAGGTPGSVRDSSFQTQSGWPGGFGIQESGAEPRSCITSRSGVMSFLPRSGRMQEAGFDIAGGGSNLR